MNGVYQADRVSQGWLRFQEELDVLTAIVRADQKRRIEGSVETTLGGADMPPEV